MLFLSEKIDSLLPNVDYEYDPKTNRFRYTSGSSKGQFLSRSASLSIVARGLDREKRSLTELADRLYDGKIGLDKFILESSDKLKQIHLFQGIIARNGLDKLTDNDKKIISGNLKNQLTSGKDPITNDKYGLKYLLKDIIKEKPSRDKLRQRLELYAESGKESFFAIQKEAKKDVGLTEARRLLGATDHHCPQCLEYFGRGWVSISDVILPTQRCDCKNRCKCSLEFR